MLKSRGHSSTCTLCEISNHLKHLCKKEGKKVALVLMSVKATSQIHTVHKHAFKLIYLATKTNFIQSPTLQNVKASLKSQILPVILHIFKK